VTGSYTIDVAAVLLAAVGGLAGMVSLLLRALNARVERETERRLTDHEERVRALEKAAADVVTPDECRASHDRLVADLRREYDAADRARSDVHAALAAVHDVARLVERDRR
jgi:hypothetical protein